MSLADFSNYHLNTGKPDYDAFPALKKANGYEVILEHGDTLFMPAGYWHPVDLQAAPFKLPPPHLVFNEGGSKRLGIWSLEDCPE